MADWEKSARPKTQPEEKPDAPAVAAPAEGKLPGERDAAQGAAPGGEVPAGGAAPARASRGCP